MEGVREEKRGEERWRAVGQKQGLTYLTTGCSAPQRLLAPLLLIVRGINRMRPAAEPSRRVDEKKVQSSRISNIFEPPRAPLDHLVPLPTPLPCRLLLSLPPAILSRRESFLGTKILCDRPLVSRGP